MHIFVPCTKGNNIMAARLNKNSKQGSKRSTKKGEGFKWNAISISKVFPFTGFLMLIAGVFLLIAIGSYFFTWKVDQSYVMLKNTEVLWNGDVQVKNALGRLGAVLAHRMMAWSFGLGSLFIIPWLFEMGYKLVSRSSLTNMGWKLFRNCCWMLVTSIMLAFLFRNTAFSFGGAFGEAMNYWLSNFMGQIGLFFLLLAASIGYFSWVFNIDYSNFSFADMRKNVNWNMNWAQALAAEGAEVISKAGMTTAATTEGSKAAATEALRPKNFSLKDKFSEDSKEMELFESHKEEATSNTVDLDDDVAPSKSDAILKPKVAPASVDSSTLELEEVVLRDQTSEDLGAHDSGRGMAITQEDDQNMTPYDATQDLSNYKLPSIDLLEDYDQGDIEIDKEELEANKDQIISTLLNYKIEITKIKATIGPTITLYEIVPAPGVRISKIKNLEDDIALSLAALGIRIIAPIPGKGTIGIEVPNKNKQIVSLKEILKSNRFKETKMALPIALGKTIANEVFIADLAKMPHLLVAGATGQGKSVGINSILISLIYKLHPSQLKLVLVDPKKVELFPYSKLLKHYLACLPEQEEAIITDTAKVVTTLNSLCIEMDNRYDLLKNARARTIKEYNEKFTSRKLNPNEGHKYLPFIVLVVDEFADLIMTAGKEVEMPIARLAQLARAVGIHLIIATQRPSVNIITGIIKANFPARIGFKVTSKIDSRTILDSGGAEQLIGRGDMLLSVGGDIVRLQGALVDTPEVEKVLDHVHGQQSYATPFYLPEYVADEDRQVGENLSVSDLDENLESAAMLVIGQQHGSTSMIQRRLKLGYNRAGRIMDQLEALGVVGPAQGSKPREVLMFSEDEFSRLMEGMTSTSS